MEIKQKTNLLSCIHQHHHVQAQKPRSRHRMVIKVCQIVEEMLYFSAICLCVQECKRSKQQVLTLRRENSTLDTEVHEKERLVSQLQMRVAVLEQEVKDKDLLMCRTKEVLEATQHQKVN